MVQSLFWIPNPCVAGSSPASGTSSNSLKNIDEQDSILIQPSLSFIFI